VRFPLFGLDPGPEWEQSVREAEREVLAAGGDPDRFEANKRAVQDVLQYDPRGYGRLFLARILHQDERPGLSRGAVSSG